MTSNIVVRNIIVEAFTELSTPLEFRFTVRRTADGQPLSVNLSDTSGTALTRTCLIHNISVGIVEFCGMSFKELLVSIIKNWKTKGIGKIDVQNSVLDHYFGAKLNSTNMEFRPEAIRFLITGAKTIINRKDASDIQAMGTALALFKSELVEDEHQVASALTYANIETVKQLISRLFNSTICEVPIKRMLPTRRGQYSEAAEQTINEVAGKLNTTPSVVTYLITLIVQHGTPRFVIEYGNYLENEKLAITTRATVEDLNELVSQINFGN